MALVYHPVRVAASANGRRRAGRLARRCQLGIDAARAAGFPQYFAGISLLGSGASVPYFGPWGAERLAAIRPTLRAEFGIR